MKLNKDCRISVMVILLFFGFIKESTAKSITKIESRSFNNNDSFDIPEKKLVLKFMKKVADWQLANPTGKALNTWEYGPFYQGVMKLYLTSKEKKYYDATVSMCNTVNWEPLPRPYDANSFAIIPAFADLYALHRDKKIIDKSRFIMDMALARDLKPEVNFDGNKYWYEWWTWCDALFMAPPAFASLSDLLNEPKYMDFMVKNWWLVSDYLYSKEDSLFFRDDSFFKQRSANGKKLFWARGNGWVIGGLCGIMSSMKKDHPERIKFEQQFVQICEKLATLQLSNGCWSSSLLDPIEYPQKETSGTAFYCYAFAWGINNGLLPKEKYYPLIQKSWKALISSVNAEGKLGNVQRVGDRPDKVGNEDSESYGSGAFLLAGSEVYKLIK